MANALAPTAIPGATAAAAMTNDYGWDDTPWLEWKYMTGQQVDSLDRDDAELAQ